MPKTLRTPRQQRLQKLLARVRKAKNLTQVDVAERLGRPQSFVAKYEGGERRLDVIEFIDVAEALETDPRPLLAKILRCLRGPSSGAEPSLGQHTTPLYHAPLTRSQANRPCQYDPFCQQNIL